jgi:hypothetical protein
VIAGCGRAPDERARQLGLGISDDHMADRIKDDPAFRGLNGQFDLSRYASFQPSSLLKVVAPHLRPLANGTRWGCRSALCRFPRREENAYGHA